MKALKTTYRSIHLNPERILTLQTMKSLAEKLPDNQFVRVHTSYSVALSRIESIKPNRIYYIGKAIIPIGDTYRDAFYRIIES